MHSLFESILAFHKTHRASLVLVVLLVGILLVAGMHTVHAQSFGTPPAVPTGVSAPYSQTINTGKTLYYYYTLSSSGRGYLAGISNPIITIGYDVGVYNPSNPSQQITAGSTVAPGAQLLLKFNPYNNNNIYWFGSGQSEDSPYGEWSSSAPSTVSCNFPEDYLNDAFIMQNSGGIVGIGFTTYAVGVYSPFRVTVPTRAFSNTTGLTCGSPVVNGDGSINETCTVNAGTTGTISPTFNFGSAQGTFYYRYGPPQNTGITYPAWSACTGDNTPMSADPAIVPGAAQAQLSTYLAPIPAYNIPYSLTVSSPNSPPNPPTMTCPTSVTTGANVTVSLKSTDPNGDQVQYAVDWLNSGGSPNSGWTSLVPSNTSGSLTKTGGYATAGTHIINGWAKDSNGSQSSPASSCTVTVTAPALSASCSVSPSSTTVGTSVNWIASPAGGTGSYTYSWTGTDSLSGTTATVAKSYATTGTKTGSVTVTSGASQVTVGCSNSLTVNPVALPDLTASLTPAEANQTATVGQPITLAATVANISSGPTNVPFATTFWTNTVQSWTGANAQYTEFTSGIPGGFPGNYSETDGPQLPVTRTFSSPGTYYYQVCADRDQNGNQTISQSNPNNDCTGWGTITVTTASTLSATCSVTPVSASRGQNVTWNATATGGTGYTYAWTGTDGLTGTTASVVTSYSLVGTKTASLTVTSGSQTVGPFMCAGDANGGASVVITNTTAPDLVAGPVSPTSATAGSSATFSATITNQGTASTGGGFTDLFQTATDGSGTGATDISTPSSPPLKSGNTIKSYLSYTFPSAGTFYMRVCADKSSSSDTGTITESDETNNCGVWTAITVNAPAPPSVSCTVDQTTVVPNTTVHYTATPANGATSPYAWTAADGATGFGTASNAYRTLTTANTYGMSVTATGAAAPAFCPNVTVSGAPSTCSGAVTPTISASPTRVTSGTASSISYNVTGMPVGTQCTLSGPGAPAKTPAGGASASCIISGSFPTPLITSQSVYTITCAGAAAQTVVVNVTPKFQEF